MKFGLTPVKWRINHRQELEYQAKQLESGELKSQVMPSGEEGIRQMRALLGLGDVITNVNLPNLGQAIGLPHGAVVEPNALISKDSVRPVLAGKLPVGIENLVIRHVLNYETILEASIPGDTSLALRGFLNDPLMNVDLLMHASYLTT